MRIKVFKARTTKEAMALVKAELGADAVILHTKRYKKGGFLGYKGKEMVEVTAAVEDQPKKNIKKPAVVSKKAPLPEGERIVPKKILNRYKTDAQFLHADEGKDNLSRFEPDYFEDKKEIKAEKKKMMEVSTAEDPQQKKIEQLQQELSQMKVMLEKVMLEKKGQDEPLVSLEQALKEQEVDPAVIADIVQSADNLAVLLDKDTTETKKFLMSYLQKKGAFSADEIQLSDQRSKIVALIGATGVGKTTTVAKIAAKFVLEKGVSAALITADTYRISAVEQLKTYSDIIGLPLEIVYSPAELKAAIEKHQDKQLILIDTAGRSQHNEFQINELKDLLAVDPAIEKHLVLSTTTKYRDAADIVRKFSVCAPDCVLFTKTDETSSLGIILNVAYKYAMHVSYLTNGQSVPDDIVPAEPQLVAELLLR